MTKCERCWENNPAEVHTCMPWYHFTREQKIEAIYDKLAEV
jgi:hypothetical protein